MAERFNINDERSFYLSGIHNLSSKIQDMDKLRLAYKYVRSAWLLDAEERGKHGQEGTDTVD